MGPGAKAIGSVDLTWLVGSVVAGAVYLVIGRPTRSALYAPNYKLAPVEVSA